nr:hypothetical protein [Tanacetum cinerariifolium]
MYTEEDNDRYIAQCFVNGLYAPDGEINLEKNDNLISNNYELKLCLKYEVRKGKKLIKKELMVSIETDLPLMVCKMGKGSWNKKKIMEKIMYFNNGAGPSSSIGTPLTQEEAEKWALAYNISMRIYEQVGRDDIMKEDRNITMINYTEVAVTSRLVNVLCQVGFTTLSAKFLIMEILVDRDAPIMVVHGFLHTIGGNIDNPNKLLTTFDGLSRQTFRAARSEKIRIAESDSDDEEDYVIKRNDMGTPVHNYRPIGYQNNTNHAENMTLLTLESTSGAYNHEVGSSRTKRSRHVETIEEALLPNVHHEFLEWSGCSREAKSRYNTRLATLLSKLIYSPHIVDWQLLHKIGYEEQIDHMLKISLKEAQSNEEIFFSVAWVRAFNIREPIYPELFHEFFATYEFDEVCADDELQSKKIISFKLGGRAHSLTLLEFSRRLGLYHAEELDEEGFDTYFQGDSKNNLWLLSMFEARHQNGYANIAWVISKWIKRKGAGSQKDSQICCGQFISKIARKSKVLTEEIVCTLSTPVYCRDLDRTTLRELIDPDDRLIPDIPIDDVPRVATQRAPRVQRALMQDLYERMDSMKIRQDAIERMEYRQAYHWDRYQGVFEHMAGVYNVLLQGDYNPLGYA